MDRFLRLPAVKAATGRSRSAIYRAMEAGEFPQKISLGANCVAWLESEIQAWMKARIALSRSEGNFEGNNFSLT
jgi:prophage regulatory protein